MASTIFQNKLTFNSSEIFIAGWIPYGVEHDIQDHANFSQTSIEMGGWYTISMNLVKASIHFKLTYGTRLNSHTIPWL